jgi:hypothetical protein
LCVNANDVLSIYLTISTTKAISTLHLDFQCIVK